jgi:hypothetical protein
MKRVMEPAISFKYLDSDESQERLQTAYLKLFKIARRNLIRRKRMLGLDFIRTYLPIPIKKTKIRIINPITGDKIRTYGPENI